VVPRREPVVPQRELVVPRREPLVPQREPVVPRREPVVPRREPVIPRREPVVPRREPVVPLDEPVVPQREPVAPLDKPVVSRRDPVVPLQEPVLVISPVWRPSVVLEPDSPPAAGSLRRWAMQVAWLAVMGGASHGRLGGSRELELPIVGTLSAAVCFAAAGSVDG
jgi:hypothetical protein